MTDDPANPSDPPLEHPAASGPPGARTFTIEGRAAPALFVIGWLASLLGLAIAIAGALGGSGVLVYVVGAGLLSLGLVAACGSQAFERRARGAAYAGPSPFLVFGTMVAVLYFAASIVGGLLQLILGDVNAIWAPAGQLIAALLSAGVFVGVVALTVVGTGALSWADMQIRRFDRRAIDDLALGAALAAPVVIVTAIVSAILVSLIGTVPDSPLPPTGTFGGLILQLVVGAIIAPVSEEIVFRGFAITAWERSIGANRAIVRASLLFCLAHVVNIGGSSLGEAAGLFVVGFASRLPVSFALGLVFVRRRSIWASIGLHGTFNAILIVLAHIAITAGAT